MRTLTEWLFFSSMLHLDNPESQFPLTSCSLPSQPDAGGGPPGRTAVPWRRQGYADIPRTAQTELKKEEQFIRNVLYTGCIYVYFYVHVL